MTTAFRALRRANGSAEKAADVRSGEFDQMSALAREVGVPLCGQGSLGPVLGSTVERISFCTRPAGHNEQEEGAPPHPAFRHVTAAADGIALAVWR